MQFQAIDPSTGLVSPARPLDSDEIVQGKLMGLQIAQSAWAQTELSERSTRLHELAQLIESRADALAERMALEMGKPLAQGQSEVRKCALVCRYYADHAASMLTPSTRDADAASVEVRYEPLGIVLAVMPWNFPLWQVFRAGAPAWMGGNALLLKHAPCVPGCRDEIVALCEEVGLPLVAVDVDVHQVESLVAHPAVAGVTVTGSSRAGAAVAALAGRYIKPSVLELGGSDPFIVLADADIDAAVAQGVASRLLNAGQSCIAAKRFIVEAEVADVFVEKLEAALSAAVVGDPREPETTVGPLAREDLRDALHDQVLRSLAEGATCRIGGAVPARPGWFYPVTLLTDIEPGMTAWTEELFGPVAVVRTVADADEAIEAANDTPYGLSASLWTAPERGSELASQIHAGAVFVNAMSRSDPRMPFGGIKQSGYGRELSVEGLHAFLNAKTVWIS